MTGLNAKSLSPSEVHTMVNYLRVCCPSVPCKSANVIFVETHEIRSSSTGKTLTSNVKCHVESTPFGNALNNKATKYCLKWLLVISYYGQPFFSKCRHLPNPSTAWHACVALTDDHRYIMLAHSRPAPHKTTPTGPDLATLPSLYLSVYL
jgi:hypothetical protein